MTRRYSMGLTRNELRAEMAAARVALLELVPTLAAEGWAKPSPNEGWTARDTLAHIAAKEDEMLGLIQRGLAGEAKLPASFDLNLWNQRKVEQRRGKTTTEILGELAAVRVEAFQLLDSLGEEQFATPVEHPADPNATVGYIFARLARHERGHTEDIRRAIDDIGGRR